MGVVGTKPPTQCNALKYWQLCTKLPSVMIPSLWVHISLMIPLFPTNKKYLYYQHHPWKCIGNIAKLSVWQWKELKSEFMLLSTSTDITTAITTSSTATLDLTTFTSQFPNLQSRNWEIQRLSSVFRGHCIKTLVQLESSVGHCWPNYGSQITDPGSCLLNQTIKSQGIVWWTKYIFTLRRVWNSTTKKKDLGLNWPWRWRGV